MGAPSQQQIDDCIADGLARRDSEDVIFERCRRLQRLSDEELAAMGIRPAPERGETIAQQSPNSAKSARSARPTTAPDGIRCVSIDDAKGASAMRQHCGSEAQAAALRNPRQDEQGNTQGNNPPVSAARQS
jgi:hypothetical protein